MVCALVSAVLLAGTPAAAHAEESPSDASQSRTVTASGVLIELTSEQAEADDTHAHGWWLVTETDVFVPVDPASVVSAGGHPGDIVHAHVVIPTAVPGHRSETPGAPETSVDPLESSAAAARNTETSLSVSSLEIIQPAAELQQHRATAHPRHSIDVVYSGPRSTWPTSSQLRSNADRALQYWSEQTEGQVLGETDSVKYLENPTAVCGSLSLAVAAAQLSGRTAYEYMSGQYPGRHLLVLSHGCSGGEATLGSLHRGGWAWGGLRGKSVSENQWIMVHELGHNLGLGHGYARNCSGLTTDDVWGGSACWDVAYADMLNPMGGSSSPGLTALPIAMKHQLLGASAEPFIRTVSPAAGIQKVEVTIQALGQRTGIRGVRVEPSRGDAFYIEYREPLGTDANVQLWPMALIGPHALTHPGVRITKSHQQSPDPGDTSVDSYNSYMSTVLSHIRDGKRVFSLGVGDRSAPDGGAVLVSVRSMGNGEARVSIEFTQGHDAVPSYSGPNTERIAGADRYETSARVVRMGFPAADTVDTVVLATGSQFPDALAGAPLAKLLGAPLLLTQQDVLTASAKKEIERLKPKRIILLGGVPSISKKIETQLQSQFDVVRLAGVDRFATAEQIMSYGWPTGTDKIFVATGNNFPDALALGAAAAGQHAPILLVPGTESGLRSETIETIRASGAKQAFLAGSDAAVSVGIEQDVSKLVSAPQRFQGPNRYATAAAIAQHFGVSQAPVFIASGSTFPDAISASVYVASLPGASLVLSPQECLAPATLPVLQHKTPSRVVLLGSEKSLSTAVANYQKCWF